MLQGTRKIWPFVQGLIFGIVAALVILYFFSISGLIVVSSSPETSIVEVLNWCYENLGLSLIPFGLVFILYCFYLKQMIRLLDDPENSIPEDVSTIEDKVTLLVNIFFGIGVIWTAIGMRNSLISALGGMDAETAAEKGAFYILTQLVEGGILIALSTTIFGGIGGYLLRVVKSWMIGPKLSKYYEQLDQRERDEMNNQLRHIAFLLERMGGLESDAGSSQTISCCETQSLKPERQ